MKKLILLVLTVVFALNMNAQKIGVKAGYGMSGYLVNFYVPEESKMGMGFNAGLVAELDLKVIGVRADITYQQMGSDYYEEFDGGSVDQKTDVNYLNIGVSAKKGFGPAYVFVGPYFGYALSGNEKTTFNVDGADSQTGTADIFSEYNADFNPAEPYTDDNNWGGSGDLFSKTDFGVNLGVGASFSSIFVEANAGLGLMNFINLDSDNYSGVDTYPEDDQGNAITGDASMKNLFFGLSVGYMFGF